MTHEQKIEEKHSLVMNKLAEVLDDMFDGYGFSLLVFPLNGADGRMNYISNADRACMLVAMKEFIARNEGRIPSVSTMKQ
jgi:hypothetical protein